MSKNDLARAEEYHEDVLRFGENVRSLRIKKGLTQLELAEESDLGLRTIQRIENAQITVKLPIVFILAATLKVPVTALFKGI